MFSAEGMSVLESLTVSGLGLAVVFTTLVSLALAIIIISKLIGSFVKEEAAKPATAPAVSNGQEELNKETFAILMAVISEDLNLPMNQFKIVSIKEV